MGLQLPKLVWAMVMATFFGLISKHLPPTMVWVPCLCWVFTVLAALCDLCPHLLLHQRIMHCHYRPVEGNAPELEKPGQRIMNSDPNHELTMAIFEHVIAAIAVLTTLYYHSILSAVSLVLIPASGGFAAIWVGLLIRDTLPGFASWPGKLGVAFGLAS